MPSSDQGITNDRYTLIPRVLIFLTRGDTVLLIKGAPTKRLWANKYNGIGGHVERGEDALSAARRELLEETGLSADLRLAGTVMVDVEANIGVGLYVFTGDLSSEWADSLERTDSSERTDSLGRTRRSAQPSAEGIPEWLSLSALDDHPLVEDVAILLQRLQTMRPSDPPFSARSFYDAAGKLQVHFS